MVEGKQSNIRIKFTKKLPKKIPVTHIIVEYKQYKNKLNKLL